ncbi:MAG: hypothetical protein IJ097_05215 [Bacilli bacterium]|nr:hypothetical protein [Bacilli bacterium]
MTILIESIIGCLLFTIIAGGMTYLKPLSMINSYPPAIQEKVLELGIIKNNQKSKSIKSIIKKLIALFILTFIIAFVVYKFNNTNTFIKGFGYSYLLWNIVNWWDALVIDCIWFCHSKRVIIKGTENMKEYKDYLFHIKGGLIGMLYGVPACLLVGLFVLIF